MAVNPDKVVGGIEVIDKSDTYYFIKFKTGESATLNILNDHVFRYYMSPSGVFLEYPKPMNPDDVAKIVIKTNEDYGFEAFKQSCLKDVKTHYIVQTKDIEIIFDKIRGTLKVHNTTSDKEILSEMEPLSYVNYKSTETLKQRKDEFYYGGGMQNGRFTHKGEVINIINSNDWNDGGVASPCPFYWSTYGFGILRNTWQPGMYDFGTDGDDIIKTTHRGEDFDAFFFISDTPKDILNDYYELTGHPILMPEYAYYEAHLNAFNRDYWVEVNVGTRGAILFEDGKYYKSYKPQEIGDKKGILESLNGEMHNYQFSARAMIDRYKKHDMPLGWFIPNDGYGSGYGQTDSLDGDIQNLKEFVDYSLKNGVEVALWTESNLHPADPLHPKKGERDLSKEVGVANVVALKCDVAWIGSGYSFGLTAVENAATIFKRDTKNSVRPLIIMVDGWAGTQRCSGIWSGDQKGGEWEYIRFHIPTYIGSSLSGQPIIGSDMDGIYAGGSKEINVRDYEWKTFSPLQLNMDGWGNTPKMPFSYDEEATNINRAYLKLKSILMPYNYSIGYESIHGLPMIRAMFLEFPEYVSSYTKDSEYQYMWGPNILVAPIYNDVKIKDNSVRNGVYLPNPDQVWIDFLTGEKYQGGKIYNNIISPLWKIPVFIKDGSIIPMTNANNNPYEIKRDSRIFTIYPNGTSSFLIYEDDGTSLDYLEGISGQASTKILVSGPETNKLGDLIINIYQTNGHYKKMVKERQTLIKIMASNDIQRIKVVNNGNSILINEAKTFAEFEKKSNVFFYQKDFILNPYLNTFSQLKQKFLLIKIEKLDVTASEIMIKVHDFLNYGEIFGKFSENILLPKVNSFRVAENKNTWSSITVEWEENKDVDCFEIERDGTIFTNIFGSSFTFEGFRFESTHEFRIRSVTNNITSEWSDIVRGTTSENPFKYIIAGVQVTCNLPCQPSQEVCNLTDKNKKIWHTQWGKDGQADPDIEKYLNIQFDLGDVYELERLDYLPRDDAGNGTFLEVQYRHSTNQNDWCPLSDPIKFTWDNSIKSISFNGNKIRFLELIVLKTVGNFGSGRQVLFYKIKN